MSSAYTSKVASLLEVIAFNGNALSENGANDPTRRTLLAAVRTLTRALETPVESITRIAWAEVCILVYFIQ